MKRHPPSRTATGGNGPRPNGGVAPVGSRQARDPRAIVIAASAGGVTALQRLLSALPHDFPVPVAVVQHRMARGQGLLVEVLARETPLRVVPAVAGSRLMPGTIVLAPADQHMRVGPDLKVSLSDGSRIRYVLSSANPLFESAAESLGKGVIAVVLTGSGTDATDGVQAVKSKGGVVIAQDEATSAVFGMPGSAIKTGVVDLVLPLGEIGPALVRLAGAGTRRTSRAGRGKTKEA